MVLDVVGVSRTHNLRTLIDLSSRPDVQEIDDEDLSLLEMEEALEAMQEAEEDSSPEVYYGATAVEEFDPLARTGIGAWLQTTGGTYFLPCAKTAYVLLSPSEEPGRWDVAWLAQSAGAFLHRECRGMDTYVTADRVCDCGQGHIGAQGDLTEHQALPLDMATSWAEEVLEDLGGSTALLLAGTKKRWRKEAPSEAQLRLAARWGAELTGKETKGEVADLITTRIGSARIDPVVAFMQASR